MMPLKTLLASATPAATEPSVGIADAAIKPGDFCEIEATAAASAADCSLAFIRVASE